MRVANSPGVRFVLALCGATAASIALLAVAVVKDAGSAPTYLLLNLFLAWIPFGLAVWLAYRLRHKAWSSWEGLIVSIAWVVFLPNSFYMVSDFIHLQDYYGNQLLFMAVLFTSFIFTAFVLGLSSVYLVHRELHRRLPAKTAAAWVGLILLTCSVAIYIGRDLRWNSWDVLTDPPGLLFDLSSRLLHPSEYGTMLSVIVPFFVLIASLYVLTWQAQQNRR